MDDIFLGLASNGERQVLRLGRANRHGLVAGATGTGKTVTLQTVAEQFSGAGVPVFLADVKGDLSGICMPGSHEFKHADSLEQRARDLGEPTPDPGEPPDESAPEDETDEEAENDQAENDRQGK